MARIFTTNFQFNQKSYDAIVTIIARDGKINFTIKVMDMELQELIPNGMVSYEGKEGFERISAINNTISQALMRSISGAIENHLALP